MLNCAVAVITASMQYYKVVEIFDEIIQWASSLPIWQQTALDKILKQDELTEDDINSLVELALDEAKEPEVTAKRVGDPLAGFKYEATEEAPVRVSLSSLEATKNINAIKDGGKLNFEEAGLSVIYGNNGTGKSGFSRVLKASCSCRDTEHVHGDIRREGADESTALITYQTDDAKSEYEWTKLAKPSAALQSVNIFDSRSARVYLKGENDIKYVPAGLDIFDKLGSVVRRVGSDIADRCRVLEDSRLSVQPMFEKYDDTEVYELLGKLQDKSTKSRIDELKVLNETENARLKTLTKLVPEKESKGPVKRQQLMGLKWQRYAGLFNLLYGYHQLLTHENVDALKKLRQAMLDASKVAIQAEKERFKDSEYLEGTGSSVWRELWEAAKEYSEVVYHEHSFPNIENGAKCVLCQRTLDASATARFSSFQKFMTDKSQALAKKTKETYEDVFIEFKNPNLITTEQIEAALTELESDEFEETASIRSLLASYAADYKAVVDELNSDKYEIKLELTDADYEPAKKLKKLVDEIETEAKEIDIVEFNKQLTIEKKELADLEARSQLINYDKEIKKELADIERLRYLNIAAGTTKTGVISTKGGAFKDKYLVGSLKLSFDEELEAIYDRKLVVEMKKARTEFGVTYSEITLSADVGGKRLSPEDVMSESEQKVVSLAGYFAELSMAPHIKSAIVLDDPVTSLDHLNIAKIAKRIVNESKERQVIVFTHNIVFATHLIEQSKKILKKEPYTQEITRMPNPGNVNEGLPWDALGTAKRIKKLNAMFQDLQTTFSQGDSDKYQLAGEAFYKRVRETWERAVEEVLFGDAVKRYKRDIETNRLKNVKYLSGDHSTIEDNMSKCGNYIHDNADEESSPVPEPDIVKKDLQKLTDWVAEVRDR